MKLNLEINNLSKAPVEKPFIKKVVLETLKFSKLSFLKDKEILISFAWVGEEEIRTLNRIYRKKDSVTDVLSFPEFKSRKEMAAAKGELFLGELILCYNDIKEYSAIKALSQNSSHIPHSSSRRLCPKNSSQYPDIPQNFLNKSDANLSTDCTNYFATVPKKKGGEGALRKELATVMAHGILHLCGFRHGKKMFSLQEEAAEKVIHKN